MAMRWQAQALVVALVMTGTGEAWAQWREPGEGAAGVKGSLYADDNDTTVWTTVADVEVGLPARSRVGMHGLVDVISTASVDVVTQATARFDEVRVEAGGRAGMWVTEEVDLSLSMTHSQENDWESFAPSAGLSVDLFKRNTTLSAGYGFVHNRVGRSGDPGFEEQLQAHTAEVAVAQVIDRRSLLDVRYTFQASLGYQSSPYRYIRSFGTVFSVLERHPSERIRHALTTSGLRHLADDVALEASYRFYGDDWGVLSHTASAGIRFEFGDMVDLRGRGRFYHQRSATFWREQYDTAMEFMSLDRELSTFWDAGGGVKLGLHGEHWKVDVKVDALYYRFLDFAFLDGRIAVVGDVGGGVQW
jgi:Protein of unknown function (DUF3570)